MRSERTGIVPRSIIRTTVSLSGSPSAFTPTLVALAVGGSAKPSHPWPPNKELSFACLPSCSFPTLLPFPCLSRYFWWNEATDRQMGRWGSTMFPRPKANWERLGEDLALLNSPDMMGKSMHTSSVFESRPKWETTALMSSLLGVIRSSVSTLTPRTDNPAPKQNQHGWYRGNRGGDETQHCIEYAYFSSLRTIRPKDWRDQNLNRVLLPCLHEAWLTLCFEQNVSL